MESAGNTPVTDTGDCLLGSIYHYKNGSFLRVFVDLSVMNYDILSRSSYFLSPCVILLNRVLEEKVLYL